MGKPVEEYLPSLGMLIRQALEREEDLDMADCACWAYMTESEFRKFLVDGNDITLEQLNRICQYAFPSGVFFAAYKSDQAREDAEKILTEEILNT